MIQRITFKDWLPDIASTPGTVDALTVAHNVLPIDGVFRPYLPLFEVSSSAGALATAGSTANRQMMGGAFGIDESTGLKSLFTYFYDNAGGSSQILQFLKSSAITTNSWTVLAGSQTLAGGPFSAPDFAQFDDDLIVSTRMHVPVRIPLDGSFSYTKLAATGTAPPAAHIGIVNRFAVVGDLVGDRSKIQWSAIDDPTNWPTPNTATARSVQAGEQEMPGDLGEVNAVIGMGHVGIVLQKTGISRMTYIGGDVVFQFEVIESGIGLTHKGGAVRVGDAVYFLNADGVYVTDGNVVTPVGAGKCSNWLGSVLAQDQSSNNNFVSATADEASHMVYWRFAATSGSIPAALPEGVVPNVLILNYEEQRFSTASESQLRRYIRSPLMSQAQRTDTTFDPFFLSLPTATLSETAWIGADPPTFGILTDETIGIFLGTAGSAILETAEHEFNPGGRAFVSGVRPLASTETSLTAQAVSVTSAIRSRDNFASAGSFSGTTSPNSRSGMCDFRNDGRYHAIKVKIAGHFREVWGADVDHSPSGQV